MRSAWFGSTLSAMAAAAMAAGACGGSSSTHRDRAAGGDAGSNATACPTGTESCPCYPNSTCEGALTCISDVCVALGTDGGGASGAAGSAGTTTATSGGGGDTGSGGEAGGTVIGGNAGMAGVPVTGGAGGASGAVHVGGTAGEGGVAGSGGSSPGCSVIGPSCANTPPCNEESCCRSHLVEGGTYNRGADAAYPATVSNFCLDKYEITVGRMRAFLDDYDRWISVSGGSHPGAGAGEHVPGYGSGWQAGWNPGEELPTSAVEFRDANHLNCQPDELTWRDTAGPATQENLPINCISWYEAFAFCIWDGGRLATAAEWEYAAAGGSQEREYPWGSGSDYSRAVYDNMGDGTPGRAFTDILPVGSKPLGDGRWGQSDLAGNMWEWVFDWDASQIAPCVDCAVVATATNRVFRGGSWIDDSSYLTAVSRYVDRPVVHSANVGARCVRPTQ